jgi:hypothetical protein
MGFWENVFFGCHGDLKKAMSTDLAKLPLGKVENVLIVPVLTMATDDKNLFFPVTTSRTVPRWVCTTTLRG